MIPNRTHVLIIGIDHYDAPDVTRLQGARNDAIHWYRLCAGYLRVPPQQITVLASPPLTPAELGPGAEQSRLRGATLATVREEAKRLAHTLAEDCNVGLVTYSGHGVAVQASHGAGSNEPNESNEDADLALCPQDVTVADDTGEVDNILRFSELGSIFRRAQENLTLILDACYTGPTSPAAPPFRHLLGRRRTPATSADLLRKAGPRQDDPLAKGRLVLGTRHWMPAYEIRIGNAWRGAASFAFATLMEQWSTKIRQDVTYLNVSYRDLVTRAQRLLDDLGLEQVPSLSGLRRNDDLAVLRRGLTVTPGATSVDPDGQREERQVPVDAYNAKLITIRDASTNAIVIKVVATGDVASLPSGFSARTEYWYATSTAAVASHNLTLTSTSTQSSAAISDFVSGLTLSKALQQDIDDSDWSEWTTGDNTGGMLFKANDPDNTGEKIGLYFKYDSSGRLSDIAWYRETLNSNGTVFLSTPAELAFTPVLNSGNPSTNPNHIYAGTWYFSKMIEV